MFYVRALKVVLATVHIALADVARLLTRSSLDGDHPLTAACAAALRLSRGRASPRRPQPARGRARPDRRRGASA